MSNGPMVTAKALLRLKRELDTVYWILALFLAQAAPPKPVVQVHKPREMFDYKMRQAGERDEP